MLGWRCEALTEAVLGLATAAVLVTLAALVAGLATPEPGPTSAR
jgi:hypothetical protein